MGLFRRTPDAKRIKALASCPPGAVHDFLATPFPPLTTALGSLPVLAIDLETTGLDPAADRILSIGFVPVDGVDVMLRGARHLLIRDTAEVGASAAIHGLTDDTLASGVSLAEALRVTLAALAGRVLLAHYERLELEFLGAACQQVFGASLVCCSIDTMQLGHDYIDKTDGVVRRGDLRLHTLRARFGLPRYRAHDALSDALATAELYFALTAELGLATLAQTYSR